MTNGRFQFRSSGFNPFSFIIGALIVFFLFWIVSRLVQFIWWLGLIAMPVLLIITFILNRQILFNYVRSIRRNYQRSTALGVTTTVLSVIGLPFVSLFLFGRALLMRRAQKAQEAAYAAEEARYGEYIQYEEVDSITLLDDHNAPQARPRPEEDDEEDNPYTKLWN